MGNAPHIRSKIVWGGANPAPVSMDVKAGDLLVFTHFQRGTSLRVNATNVTTLMGGVSKRSQASGYGASAMLSVARATEDYTATLSADADTGTVSSSYADNMVAAAQQVLVAYDNVVGYQFSGSYEAPWTANAPTSHGRPKNPNSQAWEIQPQWLTDASHVLMIGAEGHDSVEKTNGPEFTPTGDPVFEVATPSYRLHTVTSAISVPVTDPTAVFTYRALPVATTAVVMPVIAIPMLCSEVPDDGGGDSGDTFYPLCMGDSTPVSLEGYWDGTQLLPAEFVGLASA